MTAHTARTAGAQRAESARSTRTGDAAADDGDLPWIEDAGRITPPDARELSRLFFHRLRILEEGTPPISTRAAPSSR